MQHDALLVHCNPVQFMVHCMLVQNVKHSILIQFQVYETWNLITLRICAFWFEDMCHCNPVQYILYLNAVFAHLCQYKTHHHWCSAQYQNAMGDQSNWTRKAALILLICLPSSIQMIGKKYSLNANRPFSVQDEAITTLPWHLSYHLPLNLIMTFIANNANRLDLLHFH